MVVLISLRATPVCVRVCIHTRLTVKNVSFWPSYFAPPLSQRGYPNHMVSWLGPRGFSGERMCGASLSLVDWARKGPLFCWSERGSLCNVCALLGQLMKGTSFLRDAKSCRISLRRGNGQATPCLFRGVMRCLSLLRARAVSRPGPWCGRLGDTSSWLPCSSVVTEGAKRL